MKIKHAVLLSSVLVMASTASAIDINSTTSLRYFPDSNMEFRVDTNGNALFDGEVNISGNSGQIASFESNQITMNQPLSIESSGPLSVDNGIDLTGTSTNTIDSYSSLYLKTSSGSPTDIVLEPTGVTDIDSNATVRGNLNVNSVEDSILELQQQGLGGSSGTVNSGWNYIEFEDSQGDRQGYVGADSSGNIQLKSDSSYVEIKDRLGVGTGSPDSSLDINGSTAKVGQIETDNPNLQIRTGGGGSDEIRFQDSANSNSNIMRLHEGGLVQIPNGRLRVGSSIYTADSGKLSEGSSMQYPTSYRGYNAKYNGSDFIFEGDGVNNAGTVIYSGIGTSGFTIARIPSTGGSQKTLTPSEVEAETDLLVRGGGNVEIPNGNLTVSKSSGPVENAVTTAGGGNENSVAARLYAGQDSNFGGGIKYLEEADDIEFFRRDNGVETTVLEYEYGNSNVNIPNGNLDMGNNDIIDMNSFYLDSNSVTSFWDGTPSSPSGRLLKIYDSGNVEIPNGNLGIGTSPNHAIEIDRSGQQTIRVRSSDASGSQILLDQGGDRNAHLVNNGDGTFDIEDNNKEAISVNFANENVQIPNGDMTVGTGSASNQEIVVDSGDNSNFATLRLDGHYHDVNGDSAPFEMGQIKFADDEDGGNADATIETYATQDHNSGDNPTEMQFYTTPAGSDTLKKALELQASQDVNIPNGNLDMNGNKIQEVSGIRNRMGMDVYDSTGEHNSLASGWYTIANATGEDRASAKFVVKDQEGGKHSSTHFYAATQFGRGHVINVLSSADYGSGCVEKIRILAAGTYDGANLQVYLDSADCNGVQAFLMENFQQSGWQLKDWLSTSDPELSEEKRISLDSFPDDAVRFTEGIETKGPVEVNQNEINNPVIDKRSSDPSSPAVGQMWYRTDLD